jgi:hypothetical protein
VGIRPLGQVFFMDIIKVNAATNHLCAIEGFFLTYHTNLSLPYF